MSLQLAEYKSSMLKTQVGTDFDVPEEGVLKLFVLCEIGKRLDCPQIIVSSSMIYCNL